MRRRNCKLKDFTSQGSKINCARFSRKLGLQQDNQSQQHKHQYFVTGDNHNNIRFYQFLGQQQLKCFINNPNNTVQSQVSAVSISSSEISIYSGSNRGIINVWDIIQGKNTPLCTLKGHATSVNCFGMFPKQDTRVASGSYDTHIKLWDVRQKNNYAMLKHHTKQINSIDISPDGNFLLSGSQDNTTKLWDLRSPQKVLSTYSQHDAPVIKAIFNPEDCMFASCSADRTVKYFSCDKMIGSYGFVSSTDLVSMPITAIDFNLDGSLLCTAGNDILKIWDMRRKNSLLIQSIDSAWKGVQDVLWCEKGIKGLSSYGGCLSVWFCYLGDQMQQQTKKQQQQFKLPKILKNPSIKHEQKKIKSIDMKQLQQNHKYIERNKDLQQVMNNVNLALGHLNNVTQMKNREQKEKQLQYKKKQQQKLKEEQKKQKLKLQKQKQKQQKQKQQKQQKQKKQKQKLQKLLQQQQKCKQQKLQQLQFQRLQRQKVLQDKIHQTFQNNHKNLQITLHNDILENSSVMNISIFIDNAAQKQKLVQIQTIAQIIKQKGRFQSVYKIRSSSVKPIIHYWKQGKIDSAMYTLSQADLAVAYDCISAILHNSTFKMGITPDAACGLIKKLIQIMNNKHSTYVKNAMSFLNQIVLMFKDQLIKIKTFNPMTRVDLSRQERLAKYDKLTQNFLNVFKQQRLKKYASTTKSTQNQELYGIASQLYKNLQQMLRKIMPKKQPDAA